MWAEELLWNMQQPILDSAVPPHAPFTRTLTPDLWRTPWKSQLIRGRKRTGLCLPCPTSQPSVMWRLASDIMCAVQDTDESWYMTAIPRFSNPVLILNVFNLMLRWETEDLSWLQHKLSIALLSACNMLSAPHTNTRRRWASVLLRDLPPMLTVFLGSFHSQLYGTRGVSDFFIRDREFLEH